MSHPLKKQKLWTKDVDLAGNRIFIIHCMIGSCNQVFTRISRSRRSRQTICLPKQICTTENLVPLPAATSRFYYYVWINSTVAKYRDSLIYLIFFSECSSWIYTALSWVCYHDVIVILLTINFNYVIIRI